jgi:YfiH family protein
MTDFNLQKFFDIVPQISRLGWKHGFSHKPFDAREPKDLCALAQSLDRQTIFMPNQVHGIEICEPDILASCSADAILLDTHAPSPMAAGIQTADCVPLILIAVNGACLVHAGWRGLAAGIVERAVNLLEERCGELIFAAIGPCAGDQAYEVGPEVVAAIGQGRSCYSKPSISGKYLLDLKTTAQEILKTKVTEAQLWISPVCTITSLEHHSFRRDGARAGRNLSFLCYNPEKTSKQRSRGFC